MTEVITTLAQAESALRVGAALLVRPEAGVLRLTDADRADFLHRMTTNEINRLAVGQATVTVLTSPTARILHVFTVLARTDELWLLPAPGATVSLERHLRGQIFFMDKVKVTNLSESHRRLRVMGPQAADALQRAGLAVAELADHTWVEATLATDGEALTVTVLKQLAYELPGYELITSVEMVDALLARLYAAGIVAVDEATYEVRRIELGRPAAGHELTEEYNPLEAGIGWSCADNKGCYTGQEIIARQITYDKITKTLVGVQSDTLLKMGTELQVDGRTVGVVTSSAVSPTLEAPIALAIVRRPYHEVGTTLSGVAPQSAQPAANNAQTVIVTALPLTS